MQLMVMPYAKLHRKVCCQVAHGSSTSELQGSYGAHLGDTIAPSAKWSATSSCWLICSGDAVAVADDAQPTFGGLSVTSNKMDCTV